MSKKQFINDFEPQIGNFCKLISNNESLKSGNLKFSVNYDFQNKVIISTMDQLMEFNKIINHIAFYGDFNGSFSTKYIETKLFELLHKLLSDYTKANEYIGELYTNLTGDSNNEWFVITQLENVKTRSSRPFKLIDSTIKYMQPQDFLIESTAIQFKSQEESQTSFLNKFLGYNSSDWIQKPCIYTIVKAGDNIKAEELAIDNFNLSLNLLRLYFPNSNIAIKKPVSVSDNGEIVAQGIVSFNKTKGCGNSSYNRNGLTANVLSIELYKALEEEGINNLSSNSEMTTVIKNCLYWYGLALDTSLQSAKLFFYVTILESTLKYREDDELTQRIADRCALFLGTDFDTRKDICKDLKDIYKLRSKVVHAGQLIGKMSDNKLSKIVEHQKLIGLASDYSRMVLLKLIKNNSQLDGSHEKFISDIDDLKYKYVKKEDA